MERRLTPTRMPDRATSDRAALDALLDEVLVAQIGLTLPEGPLVLPIGFARWEDRLIVHGSTGSRWLRVLAEGANVCVSVTALDAIKVADSAFDSGMNYRSACLFGKFERLTGAEAAAALDQFTDRVLPGRTSEVRPNTAKELAATMVLSLPITHWSLKSSTGFPDDQEPGQESVWVGLVPLRAGFAAPIPNPGLASEVVLPDSVRALETQMDSGS